MENKLLIFLPDENLYQYAGLDQKYSVLVFSKPQGSKHEFVVGHWVSGEYFDFPPADLDDSPQLITTEGGSKKIIVNSYERDPKAREECIKHYGCFCQVCRFDFEKAYGDVGKGYIHVHHIVPLSTINASYVVNPIKDLLPLCPNCHAMIHKFKPTPHPKVLKELLLNKETLKAD